MISTVEVRVPNRCANGRSPRFRIAALRIPLFAYCAIPVRRCAILVRRCHGSSSRSPECYPRSLPCLCSRTPFLFPSLVPPYAREALNHHLSPRSRYIRSHSADLNRASPLFVSIHFFFHVAAPSYGLMRPHLSNFAFTASVILESYLKSPISWPDVCM